MRKIIIASNNRGKIYELQYFFADTDIKVHSQSEYGVPEIQETGLTFVENAILKARNAAKMTGFPAIADDSGLVVDALNGEPGIYSARYAGEEADDALNIEKLLRNLIGVPENKRTARFHCALVFLRRAFDPCPLISEGSWEGQILFAPRGSLGFGYDPIFYVSSHHCSAGELAPDIKNQLSHRGQAMQKLVKQLKFLDAF
jgi:XTP/dITP diphosphohydrolase